MHIHCRCTDSTMCNNSTFNLFMHNTLKFRRKWDRSTAPSPARLCCTTTPSTRQPPASASVECRCNNGRRKATTLAPPRMCCHQMTSFSTGPASPLDCRCCRNNTQLLLDRIHHTDSTAFHVGCSESGYLIIGPIAIVRYNPQYAHEK